ncbi:hypothetical protein [Streptomyces venezuelae]
MAWIEADGDGPEYFGLVFGQGVSPRELAVRLGAPEDSPVLDPATIERIEQAWPTHRYDDPNIGRIGDAGNGWSFCLLPCAAMETSGSDNPWGEVTGRTLPGMVCEPREFRNSATHPKDRPNATRRGTASGPSASTSDTSARADRSTCAAAGPGGRCS